MIRLEDRQVMVGHIEHAHGAGARLKPACELAGIDLRTLQRWKAGDGLVHGDGRPAAVHETPAHALTEAERAKLLAVANEPRFAEVPPARIVPMLARLMKASTWPANRAFTGYCASKDRPVVADGPMPRGRPVHRPRISPPDRIRCGAGI